MNEERRLFMGVDIGSTSSKIVVLDSSAALVAYDLDEAGAGTAGPMRVFERMLEKMDISKDQLTSVFATGYGRKSFAFADKEMSELSCHAQGAAFLMPGVHTVIDIGGQDAKVLQVDASGGLVNFAMNDKCAAGTGRFLEVMAKIMELQVSQLAQIGALANLPVKISSTCTVFAESEVISQLANNVPIPDIVAGVHKSVAERVTGLVGRVGVREAVGMTGGVALNEGIVAALQKQLGTSIQTSRFSQLTGAYGAALFALKSAT